MKIRVRWTDSPQKSQRTRSRLSPVLRLALCSVCALWLCGVVAVRGAQAQEQRVADMPLVEKVDVQGAQFLQKETLLFYVSLKPGERYDERRLKDDFRRLWDTGFLDDMRVDVLDGEQGKVIVFTVKERKRIQIVDYRGSKALTTSNIEDKLKEKDAALRLDTFYDPAKARRIEGIIRDMLAEKGRPFGTVKHDAKAVGGAGLQVSFVIDDGAKAKIKNIEFTGNEKFTDGKLRGTMKTLKPAGFWNLSWLGGKSTYTEDKWVEPDKGGRARLQEFYLNRGYVTATIGEPQITYADKPGGSKKKPVKWATLTIPVTEGDEYRLGDLKFDGMTIVKEEYARSLFKMAPGDVYEEKQFKKAYDKLRDAYGSLGYFQWTVLTDRKPDPEKKTVDVTVRMDEDKQYFVSKIRFTGNDTTRDKVIRREVYMNEGDVFNTEALKLSIRRINQLGYFKPMEQPPHIAPSAAGDNKLDVTFKVEEQNRNQFTFGGGVSGLEGTFINASFSTANFLGAGETFQISAQSGRRTKNYQIAITEPYMFDRPITAGIDLFSRSITYETIDNVIGYKQASKGGSLVAGIPLGRFTRLFANYAYEVIDISGVEVGPPPTDPDEPPSTDPIFDPFLGGTGRRRESRITPSVVMNTVDNPWTPRSGKKLSGTFQVAGGILGGTVNYFRPDAEAVLYIPHLRRTALGMRAQVAYIKPYGDTVLLPYYQRFFLGGETQIRGFNIRSVGPLGPENRALGGNKYGLFNAEYYIDIGGPLRFLFFFDAGQAFLEGDPISVKEFLTSTGAELRFIMPVLNVPFRLIYAYNPTREFFHDKQTFKFAVGTTF